MSNNKFQQFAEQNKDAFSNSDGMPTFYTGLGVTKVLGINPTEKQLASIIGEDSAKKFNTDYAVEDNPYLDVKTRPIVFWVQDKEEKISPILATINISKEDAPKSSNGNVKIINDKAQTSWAESVEAMKEKLEKADNMGWFSKKGLRIAKIGEEEYYNFISTILRFNHNNDQKDFISYCEEMGIGFNTALKGEFSGLHQLVDYLHMDGGEKEPNYIVGLYAVKEKDDGRLRQEFSMNPDTWFRCTNEIVTPGMLTTLSKRAEGYEERGANIVGTRQYSATKLQEFNPNSLDAPDDIASQETDDAKDALDDIGWLE